MSATLTILETVYYRPADDAQPTATEARWTRALSGTEQVYVRELSAGPEWAPLDVGWIGQAGLLVLSNGEGRFTRVRPTDEERAAAAAKIIEVGWRGEACWLVRPGESLRAEPANLGGLTLRCQQGTARTTLTLYPA